MTEERYETGTRLKHALATINQIYMEQWTKIDRLDQECANLETERDNLLLELEQGEQPK